MKCYRLDTFIPSVEPNLISLIKGKISSQLFPADTTCTLLIVPILCTLQSETKSYQDYFMLIK